MGYHSLLALLQHCANLRHIDLYFLVLIILLDEGLNAFVSVPEIDNLTPEPSQNNHFVVPPLHQVEQPTYKAKDHNYDQTVEEDFLVLGGLGVTHVQVVVDGELAIFVVVFFGGLAVVVVLA